ncbi:MAG: glycosyltransferase [Spirochaetes bacterium]|nr:glycosyltransferase [Spirochaetota bacterium]
MKIIHIIDSLKIGGAGKVCLNLITLLIDASHQANCMVISARGQFFNKLTTDQKPSFLTEETSSIYL